MLLNAGGKARVGNVDGVIMGALGACSWGAGGSQPLQGSTVTQGSAGVYAGTSAIPGSSLASATNQVPRGFEGVLVATNPDGSPPSKGPGDTK